MKAKYYNQPVEQTNGTMSNAKIRQTVDATNAKQTNSNIKTCRVSKLHEQNITYYINLYCIAKLCTEFYSRTYLYLRLDYRDASLQLFYHV